MGTNCYITGDKKVALTDPGANGEAIVKYLLDEELELEAIFVTHGHFDHVGALAYLKERTGARVYMHKDDIQMLGDMEKSLGFMTGETPEKCEVDVVLSGNETITVGDDTYFVMHTPGHSQGSVSYIGDGFVLSGDLIFKESIGRYDFGCFSDEMDSIKRLFEKIESDFVILPGHGQETTMAYEAENNPYIVNMK